MKIDRSTLTWAAGFAAIAVILGALGAHALKNYLEPSSLESFETGVRYQMWHALALFIAAIIPEDSLNLKWVKRLWITGIILFSGSIFLLSTAPIFHSDFAFLGPITPLGGLALISGWIILFIRSLQKNNNP